MFVWIFVLSVSSCSVGQRWWMHQDFAFNFLSLDCLVTGLGVWNPCKSPRPTLETDFSSFWCECYFLEFWWLKQMWSLGVGRSMLVSPGAGQGPPPHMDPASNEEASLPLPFLFSSCFLSTPSPSLPSHPVFTKGLLWAYSSTWRHYARMDALPWLVGTCLSKVSPNCVLNPALYPLLLQQ